VTVAIAGGAPLAGDHLAVERPDDEISVPASRPASHPGR
jgi:hypothetical protein